MTVTKKIKKKEKVQPNYNDKIKLQLLHILRPNYWCRLWLPAPGVDSNSMGNHEITSSNPFSHWHYIWSLWLANSRHEWLGKGSTQRIIIHIVILQRVRSYKIQFPCMDVWKISQKLLGIEAHPHSIPVVYRAYGIAHDLYIF